jgi:SAM-dependent methyltransferase
VKKPIDGASNADSAEHYDRSYFNRWYRDPSTRVKSLTAIRRKATLTIALAEYYLERPVRSVLDVGCGEGNWLPALRSIRPRIHYTGVDSSHYAVERFGRSRSIRHGSFGTLGECNLKNSYDLVICSDLLFYLPIDELKLGLAFLAPRTAGLAFLEFYTEADSVIGDFPRKGLKTASFYKALLKSHGFLPVGSHCHLGPAIAYHAMEMEKGI